MMLVGGVGGGWCWWWVVVCKPILVFSLSLGQAEQQKSRHGLVENRMFFLNSWSSKSGNRMLLMKSGSGKYKQDSREKFW